MAVPVNLDGHSMDAILANMVGELFFKGFGDLRGKVFWDIELECDHESRRPRIWKLSKGDS